MADENVTRIHPAPSIPNPLFENPWARLTDEEIADSILSVNARIDAAEHTKRSLKRELARRHPCDCASIAGCWCGIGKPCPPCAASRDEPHTCATDEERRDFAPESDVPAGARS